MPDLPFDMAQPWLHKSFNWHGHDNNLGGRERGWGGKGGEGDLHSGMQQGPHLGCR